MNVLSTRLAACCLLGVLAAAPGLASRDPFWPIGYVPPKPEPPPAARAAETPAAPLVRPPAVQPITEEDWAIARKALVISGFTRSVRPDSQTARSLAMINRTLVAPGDLVTLIHNNIRFQWRADAVTENDVRLAPVKAERVAPKNTDLQQKQ